QLDELLTLEDRDARLLQGAVENDSFVQSTTETLSAGDRPARGGRGPDTDLSGSRPTASTPLLPSGGATGEREPGRGARLSRARTMRSLFATFEPRSGLAP